MPRARIATAAFAAALLFGTASSLAATIVGTSHADTLRGTMQADRLYGKAGNDILLGRGGNDLLTGGPGADRLVCGPGRDVARADRRDTVARDCEKVTGLGPPPPPTTPGTYCGYTSQDPSICLEVGAGPFGVQAVSRIVLTVQTGCQPARQAVFMYALTTDGGRVQRPSVRVARGLLGPRGHRRGRVPPLPPTAVAGTLRVQVVEDRAGVEHRCDSGVVSWTARTPPPAPSAQLGRFCGLTEQGLGLCFDVAGSPKGVSGLELRVRVECMPPATLGVSTTIPTAYAIRDDNTFTFTRTGTGTTADGGSFTVTHTMQGAFDEAGTSATGTLAAHVSYARGDGSQHECDSGSFCLERATPVARRR